MYIENEDTIAAPATIPGTGAITVIRVSGKDTFAIADKVLECKKGPVSDAPAYTVRYCSISLPDGKPLDDVLVSIFRAPHSYTGEDSIEISCHASKYIAEQIIFLLIGAGARAAEPGEFTKRAFLNGKMDLAESEAVADLISSQSASAHRIAYNQLKGGFSKELSGMRQSLLEITSLMELELDFSDEEVEFADRGKLNKLVDEVLEHTARLISSFRTGNAIKNGVPVAIAGAVNTGKSTLLNALLGEDRAIVSDVAGTTRDTVEETLDLDGVLFRFIDTAGIRDTSETVEKIGIERTFRKISEAEIVLGMLDLTGTPETILGNAEKIASQMDFGHQRLILLLNKEDVVAGQESVGNILDLEKFSDEKEENSQNGDKIEPDNKENALNKNVININNIVSFIDNKLVNPNINVLPISAKKGTGLDRLKTLLVSYRKDMLTDSDTSTVTNARHYEALSKTSEALERVKSGLASGIPTDLVAQDLREALYHLGTIVGEVTTDEVLGNIFSHFCIGK